MQGEVDGKENASGAEGPDECARLIIGECRTLYARYGSNVHVNPNRQSDAAPSKPATAMHVAIMRLLTGSPNHVTHARVVATAERRAVQWDVQE